MLLMICFPLLQDGNIVGSEIELTADRNQKSRAVFEIDGTKIGASAQASRV